MRPLVTTEWLAGEIGKPDLVVFDATKYLPNEDKDGRVEFAKAHGYTRPLSAAELEMMNLTGDGNGFDMVLMPNDMRAKVPTSNFFQRGGYERNPVASVNDTVVCTVSTAILSSADFKPD